MQNDDPNQPTAAAAVLRGRDKLEGQWIDVVFGGDYDCNGPRLPMAPPLQDGEA
jgi:hypothetical protein